MKESGPDRRQFLRAALAAAGAVPLAGEAMAAAKKPERKRSEIKAPSVPENFDGVDSMLMKLASRYVDDLSSTLADVKPEQIDAPPQGALDRVRASTKAYLDMYAAHCEVAPETRTPALDSQAFTLAIIQCLSQKNVDTKVKKVLQNSWGMASSLAVSHSFPTSVGVPDADHSRDA